MVRMEYIDGLMLAEYLDTHRQHTQQVLETWHRVGNGCERCTNSVSVMAICISGISW